MPVSPVALTAADEAAAWAVYHAVFPHQWSREGFAGLYRAGASLGVYHEGALAGVVLWRVIADEAELLTLAVAEAARRSGLGRALMEGMHRALAEAGIRAVHLEVAAGNHAARALYAALGYGQTGLRRGYYPGGEDGLTLSRAIGTGSG